MPEFQLAEAVVLVNSESADYADFLIYIKPYLDHLDIGYKTTDISRENITGKIKSYALVILGHRNLDTPNSRLKAAAQKLLLDAVKNGTGLLSFETNLGPENKCSYKLLRDIFGFSVKGTAHTRRIDVSSPAHYITSDHRDGHISLRSDVSFGKTAVKDGTRALLEGNSAGLLFAALYGRGKCVQWMSYEWMSVSKLGPMYDTDNFLWKSIVWAARKPFVMQSLPPLVTMRMDDSTGPYRWVDIANKYGFKPWLGLFIEDLAPGDISHLKSLIDKGNATAVIHAFSQNKFFYFNHSEWEEFDDNVSAGHIKEGDDWYRKHNIAPSKVLIPHYYEISRNFFPQAAGWGMEFTAVCVPPGMSLGIGEKPRDPVKRKKLIPEQWLKGKPFRLYETGHPFYAIPVYYADYLEIAGYPKLKNKFFNVVCEIRDNAGYEWYPEPDVEKTVEKGLAQLERALNNKALAVLFTHEYFFNDPKDRHAVIKDSDLDEIMKRISTGIRKYSPEFVTLDYACRYIRAAYNSKIEGSTFRDGVLKTTFSGSSDMETKFYCFYETAGEIKHKFISLPPFNKKITVSSKFA